MLTIDVSSGDEVASGVVEWASGLESRYICFAPVSTVMEAYDSAEFRRVMNEADLVAPDGMPLVWALRLKGFREASRVYGPDVTLEVLEAAAKEGIPVGFYGGSGDTLGRLVEAVRARFPVLRVAYSWSPPFRPLTAEEDEEVVRAINGSGARIVFVGIGSPKQEYWMAAHKGRVQAVMLGVGAAFDFIAGTKRQAPRWMMGAGLEWAFRLATEPRRLWKRYLKHNPRFVALAAWEVARWRLNPRWRRTEDGCRP